MYFENTNSPKLVSNNVKHELNNLLRELIILSFIINSFIILFEIYSGTTNQLIFTNWALNIPVGIALLTSLIIIFRTRLRKIEGNTFLSLTIGIILWFAAEITWTYYQIGLNIEVPYPSIADLLWLMGYLFVGYQLYNSLRFMNRSVYKIKKTDIFVVAFIIFSIIGYLLYTTIINEIDNYNLLGFDNKNLISSIVSLLYPILDGILLLPAILIMKVIPKSDPLFIHWMFMFIFIILWIPADIGFGYSYSISEEAAAEYEWIWDIFFNIGYISLAGALIWVDKVSQILNNNIEYNLNTHRKRTKSTSRKQEIVKKDVMTDSKLIDTFDKNLLKDEDNDEKLKLKIQQEEGEYERTEIEFTKNISNPDDLKTYFDKFLSEAKHEILIIFSRNYPRQMINEKYIFEKVSNIQKMNNIKVKIIVPPKMNLNNNLSLGQKTSSIEIHKNTKILRANLIVILRDNKSVLYIEKDKQQKQYQDEHQLFSSSFSSSSCSSTPNLESEIATVTNNSKTVLTYLSIFENLWMLSILNEQKVV